MDYDLIIIGSGPAGCAASIYASRYKLDNLVLGKTKGGTISYAHKVDNYPGLLGLSGLELMAKVEDHVKSLGTQIIYDPVDKIEKTASSFMVYTQSGKNYESRAVIVATGTERRKLNIPGEKELIGKGVSYCVTCDAPFYKGKTVALVGGSDAACSGAVHLAEFAKKIYLIYRGGCLRAEPFWTSQWEELVKTGKGETIYNTNVIEVLSKSQIPNLQTNTREDQKADVVGGVKLDRLYQGDYLLVVDGLFIEIGGVPGATLVKQLGVEVDDQGYIKTGSAGETNISGLFAAGDITDRSKTMPQVVTAVASGAQAASSAYKYLKGQQAPGIHG